MYYMLHCTCKICHLTHYTLYTLLLITLHFTNIFYTCRNITSTYSYRVTQNKVYHLLAILYLILAGACGVPVGRRSSGRLAATLVATINVIIFFSFLFFFSPSSTFLIEGVLGSKNLFSKSCLARPKT